jgi:hypothetical protein
MVIKREGNEKVDKGRGRTGKLPKRVSRVNFFKKHYNLINHAVGFNIHCTAG